MEKGSDGGRDPNMYWESFEVVEYFHYVDCGDDFTGVYIYQNSSYLNS